MRYNKFRGNVFVANLPNGFKDEELAQLFDPYGIVLDAFMAREADGRTTKGCGLVNIAPPRAAAAAIAALHGTKVTGRQIEVRAAAPNMAISIPKPKLAGAPARRPPRIALTDEAGAVDRPVTARRAPQRPVVVEYRNRFKAFTPGLDRG